MLVGAGGDARPTVLVGAGGDARMVAVVPDELVERADGRIGGSSTLRKLQAQIIGRSARSLPARGHGSSGWPNGLLNRLLPRPWCLATVVQAPP